MVPMAPCRSSSRNIIPPSPPKIFTEGLASSTWLTFIGEGSSSSFRNDSRGDSAASAAISSTLMVIPPTAGGKSCTTTGRSMASATAR